MENDQSWGLWLGSENARRTAQKRTGRRYYGAKHGRDVLTDWFADMVASGRMVCTEHDSEGVMMRAAELDVKAARDNLENVRVATIGGAEGGCPKLKSGIWRGVKADNKDPKVRAENIKWMLNRYEELAATKNGRKAVREMLRDAEILEKVKIPGGVQSLSAKRVDAIRAQCEDALKTP